MSTSSHRYRSSFNKGFTLIELMVVVAVITIVTAVVLFSQSKFDSSTLLRSLAYSVALSVSQAQTYGTSVRGTTGSINFAPSYGVYFDQGDLSLSPQQYYIFADNNGDGCDAGDAACPSNAGSENLPAELVPNGYVITKFCGAVNSTTQDCYPSSATGQSLTSLTIYFKRPDPDACIASSAYPSACATGGTQAYSAAYVEMSGAAGVGDFRTVKVTTTGEIIVCPLDEDWSTTPAC